ncbi:hypothetical protein D3C75_558800 [compost metagenome]
MKKMMLKASAAVLLLTQVIAGGVPAAAAEQPAPKVAAAAATAAPVMTDNLAKYGLKKDMELPVTLSSGGFSYTLHKIMIFDVNSKEVVNLKKTYGFQDVGGVIQDPKYFIWTKVTIQNNTKKTIHGGGNDIIRLVRFTFRDGASPDPVWPMKLASKTNSADALWTYDLKPGQKITSYLAYYFKDSLDYFVIRLFNGSAPVEKFVVPE